MAPYRPSGRANRSGRAQIDHDVFEGLPVRHWRRSPLTIGSSSKVDTTVSRTLQPELPMPKDAHLLSPMSRALLQAARAGTVNRLAPPPEDDKEVVDDDDDVGETERGFVAKKWGVIPRHLEGPEPEYLAKRRKGLASPYSSLTGPVGGPGPLTKTKVRKVDSDGNSYILEVLVPEGQKVEGEVVEEVPMTEAPAPGTVVEGVGVVNADGVVIADNMQPTPPRRRPPPPKRKPKGPGRGRKKKVQFAPGGEGAEGTIVGTELPKSLKTVDDANGFLSPDDIKAEDAAARENSIGDGDADMADDSNGEGDEGDDGEDDDREEGELSPSPVADNQGSPLPLKSLSKPPQPELQPTSNTTEPLVDISLSPRPTTKSASVAVGPIDLSLPPKPIAPLPELRDVSSSPDIPLAATRSEAPTEAILMYSPHVPGNNTSPSRNAIDRDHVMQAEHDTGPVSIGTAVTDEPHSRPQELPETSTKGAGSATENVLFSQQVEVRFPDGDVDLFGSLERHLEGQGNSVLQERASG